MIEPSQLPSNSSEFRLECVFCHNPKNKFYINALTGSYNCFHCGHRGGYRSFQRIYEPPSPEEQGLEDFVSWCSDQLAQSPETLGYLIERGIEPETIEKARLGYCPPGQSEDPNFKAAGLVDEENNLILSNRIIIPYLVDGYVTTVRGRGEEPKYKGLKGSKLQVYSPFGINVELPIVVCEGEFDQLRLYQEGYNSVGVPGVSCTELIKGLQASGQKLYLALDGDEAGRKATDGILKLLPEAYKIELPDGVDVSEYLDAFGENSFDELFKNSKLYVEGKEQPNDSLFSALESWSEWAWKNGERLGPKISWAPRLDKALSGWSRGLFMLGAVTNAGKTGFQVKSAYHAAKDNDDTMVYFLSLDDDQEDTLTRLLSLHTKIPFEEIRSPKYSLDNPDDMSRRKPDYLKKLFTGIDELKEIKNLVVRDTRYGRSLSYIRNFIKTQRRRYPNHKLVFFIDSLAKVTNENENSVLPITNWKAYLATELKYLSTVYDACIITPADFRKLNEFRRPTNDDLKDAAELAYEANGILLGFNELHMKGNADDTLLKWTDKQGNIWPIFELNLSKNKRSLYRGYIRYKFRPDVCNFSELTLEEDQEFTRKMQQSNYLPLPETPPQLEGQGEFQFGR